MGFFDDNPDAKAKEDEKTAEPVIAAPESQAKDDTPKGDAKSEAPKAPEAPKADDKK